MSPTDIFTSNNRKNYITFLQGFIVENIFIITIFMYQ
jgi:hypothetical protein